MVNHKHTSASLATLPPELLIKIILLLDFHSVLCFQRVNTAFNDLVKNYAAVQYHIELGVAGMVDGPSFPRAPFTIAERLRRLRLYQSRWTHMRHVKEQTVRHARGGVWELAQGVLAQGIKTPGAVPTEVRKLFFTRLSSSARAECRTREWSHSGYEFAVRDFTMDPSQDLLVLVRASSRYGVEADADADVGDTCQLEFRSLSTNKKHSKAKSGTLVHALDGGTRPYSHSMQICQDLFAVLHTAFGGTWPDKMVLYNWKTSKLIFEISFCSLISYTFLTPNHLLFAVQSFNVVPARAGDHQPRFVVCDIAATAALSAEGQPNAYVALAEFHLPEMGQYTEVSDVLIRSDPAPALGSETDDDDDEGETVGAGGGRAAFSTAPENRLFVINLQVATAPDDVGDHRVSEFLTLCIFVPLSTFLPFLFPSSTQIKPEIIPATSSSSPIPTPSPSSPSSLPSLPPRHIAIPHTHWLQRGARALLLPGAENVWVCNVYGSRFIAALEARDTVALRARRHVAVYDFGVGVRRGLGGCGLKGDVGRESGGGVSESGSGSGSGSGSEDGTEKGGRMSSEEEKDKKALPDPEPEYYTEPSTLDATKCLIFEEDVTTCLPYRRTVLREKVRFDGVMLTEDNIIFVNKKAPKEYEVLTF